MLMENKFGKISRITACAALKNGKTILEDLSFTCLLYTSDAADE